MVEYRDIKTGADVKMTAKESKASLPSTSKILQVKRPPVTTVVSTD